MLEIQNKTEKNLITDGGGNMQKMTEILISKLKEREVLYHERKAPLNMKYVRKPDSKVPDVAGEYFDRGNLNKFAYINSDIQKHLLTIDINEIIALQIDSWGISLVLHQYVFDGDWDSHYDVPNLKRDMNSVVYSQRMLYKDAILILEKIGYKKEDDYIVIDKSENKVIDYCICEEWVCDNHFTIYKYLLEKYNEQSKQSD